MPSWKKVITSGSDASLNSLTVTNGITGSLFGTASYAVSASQALTASYAINPIISGSINNVDYIDFNTGSATPTWRSGRLFWDNTDGCLGVYNAEADVTLNVGQENWTRVYNSTGASIANGLPVRITGTHGDVPEVILAQSIAVSGSANLVNQVLGIATHTIEAGTFGYITTQGLVRGLNTNTFNDGDTLYVGTGSAGALQNTAPRAPFEIIPVGQVVKASPGTSGIIYVAVQQPLDWPDLSSAIRGSGTYTYGDLWTYTQSGSLGVWRHTNQLSGSYGITGSINVSGGMTGSLFGTASFATSASVAVSSSFASQALSASFATSASQAITASFALNANSASFATSASYAASASQAITASFITTAQTASYVITAQTASFVTASNVFGPNGSNSVISSSRAISASFSTSASIAVSASFTTSASFATSASQAITASYVNPLVQTVQITGSLGVIGTTTLSGSLPTISGSILKVIGSGSTQPIFTVQGSQGELFSVTDLLSGSLFSVNDISGLPILEVFSDNTTLIGAYQAPALITTAKNVLSNSGSFTVYSLPTASYDGAFFDYTARSGSNARAGQIMAIWSGSSVNYTETTTMDFGSTSGLSLGVFISGSNMVLTGSAATTAWTIKTIIRSI